MKNVWELTYPTHVLVIGSFLTDGLLTQMTSIAWVYCGRWRYLSSQHSSRREQWNHSHFQDTTQLILDCSDVMMHLQTSLHRGQCRVSCLCLN